MNQKIMKGKAKFLGWGCVEGAEGPIVSITRCLLDGCRLVVRTDAGAAYAENNDIRNAAENFGVGLKLVDVHAIDDYDVEAIFEPVPEAKPRFIHVGVGRRMSPSNAYILATDFGGEFYIMLYREDADGNRIFLWGDDYICK